MGHTVSWNVLAPAVILPGVFFTLIAMYPFFERWATGDERVHHLLDRPRNAATRTAIGAAVIAWYGNLWAAGGNDIIAWRFQIPLLWTTWFFRIGFFVFPIVAFIVARRICLSLQRRDLQQRKEGVESGLISLTPEGEFTERHEQSSDEQAALLRTRQPRELLAAYPHHILRCRRPGASAPRRGRARTTSTSTTRSCRRAAGRAGRTARRRGSARRSRGGPSRTPRSGAGSAGFASSSGNVSAGDETARILRR